MSDPDQPGEEFDDEVIGGEYPPEEPFAVGDEDASEDDRTEPEVWESDDEGDADEVEVQLVDEEAGLPDEEDELVGEAAVVPDTGPLAPDDEFSGDETTRDVATEHAPPAAEEAAVHIDEPEPEPES